MSATERLKASVKEYTKEPDYKFVARLIDRWADHHESSLSEETNQQKVEYLNGLWSFYEIKRSEKGRSSLTPDLHRLTNILSFYVAAQETKQVRRLERVKSVLPALLDVFGLDPEKANDVLDHVIWWVGDIDRRLSSEDRVELAGEALKEIFKHQERAIRGVAEKRAKSGILDGMDENHKNLFLTSFRLSEEKTQEVIAKVQLEKIGLDQITPNDLADLFVELIENDPDLARFLLGDKTDPNRVVPIPWATKVLLTVTGNIGDINDQRLQPAINRIKAMTAFKIQERKKGQEERTHERTNKRTIVDKLVSFIKEL